MKLKFFVNRKIQHFELRLFSFNLYVYFLTRDFCLRTRGFELVTCGFGFLTRISEIVTRVLLPHKPLCLKTHQGTRTGANNFLS